MTVGATELVEQFKTEATKAGAIVYVAKDAKEARDYVLKLAQERNVKHIVKSKSMLTEEVGLNEHLENAGIEIKETDIGAWIAQLAGERPIHMIKPAMHKTIEHMAVLISKATGETLKPDPLTLVNAARRALRQSYIDADMGISGANIAIAETGTVVIVTNEGNECLATTLPPIHVAMVGCEKIVSSWDEANAVLRLLVIGGGKRLTAYVSHITGPSKTTTIHGASGLPGQGPAEVHIVLVDNGRSQMREYPEFREALFCIKCGRCLDICPVFNSVGGHVYGHIYQGGLGAILTAFLDSTDNAEDLATLCMGCMACKEICPVRIDIPHLVTQLKTKLVKEKGLAWKSRLALRSVLKYPKRLARAIKIGSYLQWPFTNKYSMIKWLPYPLNSLARTISLPALSRHPLPDRLKKYLPLKTGTHPKIAVFAGCVVNYAYPELGEKAMAMLREYGAEPYYPQIQACCGAPAFYAGDIESAISLAKTNVAAMEEGNPDYIVTLCAGCAVMLQQYPSLLTEPEWKHQAKAMSDKIRDFSQLILELSPSSEKKPLRNKQVTYHDPCHLKRGLGIYSQPRKLLEREGFELIEMADADICCGFGNGIVLHYPELSNSVLQRKLDNIEATGVDTVVTNCAPCLVQIRGGLDKRKSNIKVMHSAELLANTGHQDKE